MPVTPAKLLAYARFLVNLSDSPEASSELREHLQRDACSKAYYACYHRAFPLALQEGLQHKRGKGGVHDQLWGFYKERRETITIGTDGSALKAIRVKADYRIGDAISPDPNDAIERAEELIALINLEEDRFAVLSAQNP